MGLTKDITIELSEASPENKSPVSKIINSGINIDAIKFKTVTGSDELLKSETPKLLPVMRFIIDAPMVTSNAAANRKTNFFFENILRVSFKVPVIIVFILDHPPIFIFSTK
jgi:hypothetical protein